MEHHTPPSFQALEFNCPLCGAYCKQIWLDVKRHFPARSVIDGKQLAVSQCTRCNKMTYWLDRVMVSTVSESSALPDRDRPDEIKHD